MGSFFEQLVKLLAFVYLRIHFELDVLLDYSIHTDQNRTLLNEVSNPSSVP